MIKGVYVYKSKYKNFVCLSKSCKCPVSVKLYKTLGKYDFGYIFTLNGTKFYMACFVRERFGFNRVADIVPVLGDISIFIRMRLKPIDKRLYDKLFFLVYEV